MPAHVIPETFQCLRCGHCCRHAGEVRLVPGEAEAIASCLGMDVLEFTRHYTRLRDDRRGLSLIDQANGACIFLAGDPPGCLIQAAKPAQCRSFPMAWRYEDAHEICAALRQTPRPAGAGYGD